MNIQLNTSDGKTYDLVTIELLEDLSLHRPSYQDAIRAAWEMFNTPRGIKRIPGVVQFYLNTDDPSSAWQIALQIREEWETTYQKCYEFSKIHQVFHIR